MKIRKGTVVFGMIVVGSVAVAQTLDPFDNHCANIRLLEDRGLQAKLGITQTQRDRMNLQARHHQDQLNDIDRRMKIKKFDPALELAKDFQELKTRVLLELKPPQVQRLREISLQEVGLVALCDPVVGRKVGMNDKQVAKMQEVYKQGLLTFRNLETTSLKKVLGPYTSLKPKSKAEADQIKAKADREIAAERKRISPQLNKIRADYDKRMRSLLTSSQSKTYEALKGKPYHP
jgi:hypothetical protein